MKPNLTIIIPSYNRGEYIEECLNSIFNQKTKHSYKIIVADDCSTDNTLEILEKYKDKIQILKSDKNQKLYKNILRAYEILDTDYFCVLDPDDFWIDENFTENALSFLEENKDYTIYAANTYALDENGRREYTKCGGGSFDLNDYFCDRAVFGTTSSSIYRNVLFKNNVPSKLYDNESVLSFESFRGDSYRTIASLEIGKLFFSKNYVSVYRITKDGMWMGSSEKNNIYMQMRLFADLFLYFDKKYPRFIYFSYLEYLKIKNEFYNYLLELKIEKIQNVLIEYNKIIKLYEENLPYIEKSLFANKKLKLKLYFYLYKKLSKKLQRKCLI